MNVEIEKRYKVTNTKETISRLQNVGFVVLNEAHIIDEWFASDSVHSPRDQSKWFDEEHGIAYRIRRIKFPDGTLSVVLDSKQHTEVGDHNTLREEVILKDSYRAAKEWIGGKNYYNFLTIDKRRLLFRSARPEFEVVLDTIEGLKEVLGYNAALEIEYKGQGVRQEALIRLGELAEEIGLLQEDIFEQSLTTQAMRVLAKFR